MSLQFRRYHYSESDRGGLLRPVICKLRSTDVHTVRVIKFTLRAPFCSVSPFIRRDLLFFLPHSQCHWRVVDRFISIYRIHRLRSLRERPRIVKAVAFETLSLKTTFVSRRNNDANHGQKLRRNRLY